MDQKTHIAPDLARHEFEGHDAIERHESAMRPHHDCPPLARDVFTPFDLNAPVVVVEEWKDPAPLGLNIVEVHTKVVEVKRLRWVAPKLARLAIQNSEQCFGTRALGYKTEVPFDLRIRHSPGVAQVFQLIARKGQAQGCEDAPPQPLN